MHDIYRLVLGREEPRDAAFPSTSFGCVTGSITLSESYQMMWYEVSSSLWALLRSFISAGNCHQVPLPFSLPHSHQLNGLSDTSNQRPVPLVRLKVISRWSCSPLRLYFLSHQGSIPSTCFIHPECSKTTQVVSEMHKRFVRACLCVCVYSCCFLWFCVISKDRNATLENKVLHEKEIHKFNFC